ncbi:MAG: hypothetical protein IT190_04080 [Microbacteriaceae bacterium]|nr:hypothetical protein [Microbacteriaceae bacterium]
MNTELQNGELPNGSVSHSGPLRPIHVPVAEMSDHPLLKRALLTSGEPNEPLIWPGFDPQQIRAVSGIRTIGERGALTVSIPPRVNLDLLITSDTDEEAPPFWKGRADDLQRYYTTCSDTGFVIVGVFTALTIDGIRRYFRWGSDGWYEIGQDGFLRARDHEDTHFAETETETIEQVVPDALKAKPVREVELNAVEFFEVDLEADDDILISEVDAIVQHGKASAIAYLAHRGQKDKLGYDYIDHPARVAANFDWLTQPFEHCAAWLHDVIEDSDVTISDLRLAGILPEIVQAVFVLTRPGGGNHGDDDDDDSGDSNEEVYYQRIRWNPIALAVKLADIDDNQAEWRVRKLDYDTQVRLSNKYFRARQLLTGDGTETRVAPATSDGLECDEEGELL